MHVFFPRYYRMLDSSGNPLLSASALWTLIDAETRTFIFPEKEGIQVSGEVTGNEIALPSGIRPLPAKRAEQFTVPYSHTDINGHMSNIRYIDECENMIPSTASSKSLKEISVEYSREVRLGETMVISLGSSDSSYFFSGDSPANVSGSKTHYFSLLLHYDAS